MQFLMTHHLHRLQQMIRDIRSFHVESILSAEELIEIKLKSHATEQILSEIEIVLANECDDITTRMVRKFPFTSNLCEDLFKKDLKEHTIDLVCDEADIFIVGHSKMKDFINQTIDEISRVSMEKNYVLKETWQLAAVMKFQLLDEIAKTFSDLIISPQEGKRSVYFHGKDETVKKAVKELERLLSDLFVAKVECDSLIIKLLICSDASEMFTRVLKKASADVLWVVDDGKLSFFSKFQINSDLVRLLLYDNFMSVGFSGMTGKSFITSKAFTDITKSRKTKCIIQEKSASGIHISSTKKVVQELLHQEKMYYEYTDNSKETQVNTTDEEISNLRTTNKEMEKRLSYLESQLKKEMSLKQDAEIKLRYAEEKNSREFESRMKLQKELISEQGDAVNIQTKCYNAFSKILQDKNVRDPLRKQSGVNIFDEGGDSVILTGDLTEIGAGREIPGLNIEQYGNISDDTSTINTLDHLTKTGNKYEKASNRHNYPETIVSETSKMQKRTVLQTNVKLQMSVDTKEDIRYTRNDTDSSFSKNCTTSYKSKTGTPEWKFRQTSDNSNVDSREKGIYPNIQGIMWDINQANSNAKGQGAIPKQYTFQQSKPDTTDNTDPKHQNVNRSKNSSTDDWYVFLTENPYVGDVPKENIHPDLKGDTKSFAKDTKVNVKTTHSKFVEPNDEFVMMITNEGIKVYVYKADMCYVRVNSIVNSTNSNMTNKFGLSKAISKNAGQAMEHQCQEYLSKYRVLEKDKVCVTHAGKLSHYKCILHVNAPIWDVNTNDKHFAGDLSKAIQMCLTEANRIGVHLFALPAISSGCGGAPEKITFKAYPKVLKFCEENEKTLVIKEIHFVDIDQNVVDHVRAAFLAAIPEPGSNFIDKLMIIPKKVREKFVSNIRAKDQAGKTTELHLPECNLVVVVCDGSLASSLKHAHIKTLMSTFGFNDYKITETAVVITEDTSFSGRSKSSRKCLERGGDSYYKNYKSLKKLSKKNKVGEIVDLYGDERLDCYHVLCMIMPTLSERAKLRNSNEQTTFFRKINECCGNALRASDQFGVTHLSLPVLCSDYYDYSAEWFLRCCVSKMITEIKEFAKCRIQKKQYMIIHIVTNGNDDVFKMFHEVMNAEQRRVERKV